MRGPNSIDTGMRNERELYRIRIEHLDWNSRTIFVPDSKTEEGRRSVPMTARAFAILRRRSREEPKAGSFQSSVGNRDT
jgi:integrase